MIAFLIDADNLSSSAWINEAFIKLKELELTEGSISIRRAYGSAENLKGLADTLRVWAVRPFVNLSLPKNTTDMSLAVDAMELACMAPRPELVVIGSGDLDFVPLVVRLREKGIKVVCVTERSKMASDAEQAYDQVIYVCGDQVDRPKVAEAKPKPIATSPAVKTATPKPAAAKKAAAKKVSAKKTTSATTESVTYEDILAAVPSLSDGKPQPLSNVAKVLHDKKLLAKNATSTKLFKKFPHQFELIPTSKPNQVRFRSPP